MRFRDVQQRARRRLRFDDAAPHVHRAWYLLGRHVQLLVDGDDVQHAACHDVRELDDTTNVLLHGRLRWRHVQLHAQRHHVPVRVQQQPVQPGPLRERELQHGSRG